MMPTVHEQQKVKARTYLETNQSWNFWVNVLVSSFFQLSMSFIYGATVLSLYVSYLTDSAVLIGLIPAIQNAMFFLPQLILARHAQTLSRVKPFVTRLSLLERVPYGVIALSILVWPSAPRWLAYAILALSLTTATAGGGLLNPSWKRMIAKVVPLRRRGLLFGLSNAIGGLMGVGGAWLSRYVFSTYDYPISFGIAFLLCFIAQLVSWALMTLNREPELEPSQQPRKPSEYRRHLPRILRQDLNFSRFLIARALMILGTMGMAFYVVYARAAFGISDAFAATLTMAALIGQTVATPLLGLFADWKGHKLLTEVSGVFALFSIILVLMAPMEHWLYAVFILMNVSMAASMISGINITMEFGPTEEMPTYSALASSIQAIPILFAPVLGGWVIDVWGYQTMFAVAIVLTVAGTLYMHWLVREPRQLKMDQEPSGFHL